MTSSAVEVIKKLETLMQSWLKKFQIQHLKSEKNETTKTNAEIEQKKQKFSIWTTIDKVASEEVATKPIKSSTAKAIIHRSTNVHGGKYFRSEKRSIRVVEWTLVYLS